MEQNSFEYVVISVRDGTATIRGTGSKCTVPREVLQRSSLLSQATSNEAEFETFVSIPVGVVESWLEALQVLRIDAGPVHNERYVRPLKKRPRQQAGYLAKCLMAADFLDDQASLEDLCKHTCYQLFAPFIEHRTEKLDMDLAMLNRLQELCEVPRNLQQLLMATSEVPLLLKMHLLPQPLQDAALHAAFPSIAATSSLTTIAFYQRHEYGAAFWQAVARQTHLTHLRCTQDSAQSGPLQRSCPLPRIMLQNIAYLTRLRSLDISGLADRSGLESMDLGIAWPLSGSIAAFTGLQELNMSDCGIGPQIMVAVAECIANLKLLRHLNMSKNVLLDTGIEALSPAIAQLLHLQTLNLNDCTIEKGSQCLAGHISHCVQLHELHYAENDGVEHVLRSLSTTACLKRLECTVDGRQRHLAECLLLMTSLQVLVISVAKEWEFDMLIFVDHLKADSENDPPPPIGIGALISSIAQLTCLQELNFSVAHYDFETAKHWLPKLAACRWLKVFNPGRLAFTSLHDSKVETLISCFPCLTEMTLQDYPNFSAESSDTEFSAFTAYLRTALSLTKLDLNYHKIGKNRAQELCAQVQGLSNLRWLDLSHVPLGLAAEDAALMLLEVSSLKHLCLRYTGFDDEGVSCIAQAIGGLSLLQSLSMAGNRCGAQGMGALAPQLAKLRSLKDLTLMDTGMQMGGAEALSKHLGCLSFLQNLDFSYDCIDSAGAAALAPSIGNLSVLTCLRLTGSCIGDTGMTALEPHLVNLKSLRELHLQRTGLHHDGVEVLARCLRKMTSLQTVMVRICELGYAELKKLPPYITVSTLGRQGEYTGI